MTSFVQGSLFSRIAAVGLLLVMIAAFGLGFVAPIWSLIEHNSELIEASRRNLARFNMLIADEEQLRARRDPKVVPSARPDFLAGEHDPAILASIQTHLRSLVTAHGGQLVSSTALPPRTMIGTSLLGVRAQISAPMAGAQAIIHGIEAGVPMLVIDRAIMRLDDRSGGAAQSNSPERLIVELDVYGAKWSGAE